ncbi:DUF4382 domain-containing protein [Vibrio makurazakiensis]|uniref:DUF4382 domain-containing protein n=1 Tax=Vibrio makurazakiensis TaxID=2910250 RepID=UPI003D0D9B18
MKKLISLILLLPFFALLTSCGGESSSSGSTASVSMSVSDSPVDDASSVTIGFAQVELVDSEGNSTYFDVTPTNPNRDYEQIDLLDYQGAQSALIINSQAIPVGVYQNLILHISNESGVNFVDDLTGTNNLKQPSNKLRLGSFEVTSEATQAFTIEFDLRKALVMRGNQGNNNGYILKPNGVSILNNSTAASLSGNVDQNLFTADVSCSVSTSNMIYLYSGLGLTVSDLIDLVDTEDEEFDTNAPVPANANQPYASTEVADNGDYTFGFLPAGDYTVAFTCNGDNDDPIQYDSAVNIPLPVNNVSEITLAAEQAGVVNFL